MRTCRTSSGEDPDEDCSPPPFFFPRGGVPPFFRCAFVAPCFCFFFFVSTFVPLPPGVVVVVVAFSRSAFSAFKTVTAAFTSSSWFVFPPSFRPFTTAACLAILPSMVVVSSSSQRSSSSSRLKTTELELELDELESVAALLENTQRCWWCSRTPRVFVVVGAIEKDADVLAKIVVGVFLRPRRRIDDDGADAIGSAGGDNIIIIVIIFGLVVVVACVRVFPLAKDHHPQKRHAAGGEDHEVVVLKVFRFFVATAAEAEKKTKTFSTTFFPFASMQNWSEEKHDKKIFCPINKYVLKK